MPFSPLRGCLHSLGFPGGSEVKASASNAGDLGSIPGSGRSPGNGNGNPLQDSCLENPMDRGAWWATVHGVAKSRTRLSNLTSLPQFKSINSLVLSFLYSPTLTSIYDYWKNHSLTRWNFVIKVMSLLLDMLSKFGIAFLPRSKCLLISGLHSPSAVVWSPRK